MRIKTLGDGEFTTAKTLVSVEKIPDGALDTIFTYKALFEDGTVKNIDKDEYARLAALLDDPVDDPVADTITQLKLQRQAVLRALGLNIDAL